MSAMDDRMAALRTRFRTGLVQEAEQLEDRLSAGDLQAARRIVHGMAGRAGMFGFPELGAMALQADEAEDDRLPELGLALIGAIRQLP